MNKARSIDVLNTLIEINNDRIEGYETALHEIKDENLKVLFAKLSQTSWQCKSELVAEVKRLGGTPMEGTKLASKFFRVWMETKSALTGNDRIAILNSCKYGEGIAVDTYEKVLEDDLANITVEQNILFNTQLNLIRTDQYAVKDMLSRLYLLENN